MSAPTTAAAAQRRLDELHAEQRDLPAAISAARRNADVAEYLRLSQRQEDLPGEVDAAQAEVYRLRLDEALQEAERCAAAEPIAQAALDDARAASEIHASQRPDGDDAEKLAAWTGEQTRLGIAVTRAAAAAEEARTATGAALAAVDDLEDAVELLTGQRPTGGDGLGATPRPLARGFAMQHPARPVGSGVVSLAAGTIPPRWAAWQLRHNPVAFLDQPSHGHPRWDQVDPAAPREANLVSGPRLGGPLGGWIA